MSEKKVVDWFTSKGKHIPIYEGESKDDAMNRYIAKENADKRDVEIAKNKEQAKRLNAMKAKAKARKDSGEKPVNTAPKKAKIIATHDKIERQLDDFDLKSLGELEDSDNVQDFIKKNLKNPEFKQFGRDRGMDAVRQLWYEYRKRKELKDIHEISIEEASKTIRENIKPSHSAGWFRQADSDYKPHIASEMFSNPGTFNAALNVAYYNYKREEVPKGEKPMSFKEWLVTPMTLYRGQKGQKFIDSDVFTSYTPKKELALEGAKGNGMLITSAHQGRGKLKKMTVRPIDTWGQLQDNNELEYLIPLTIEEKSKQRKS